MISSRDAAFFARHSLADLTRRSDHWLGQQGRLAVPVVKRPGATHYEPISWPEAYDLVAAELSTAGSPAAVTFGASTSRSSSPWSCAGAALCMLAPIPSRR